MIWEAFYPHEPFASNLKELLHDILSCSFFFCDVQNHLQREGNNAILVW